MLHAMTSSQSMQAVNSHSGLSGKHQEMGNGCCTGIVMILQVCTTQFMGFLTQANVYVSLVPAFLLALDELMLLQSCNTPTFLTTTDNPSP